MLQTVGSLSGVGLLQKAQHNPVDVVRSEHFPVRTLNAEVLEVACQVELGNLIEYRLQLLDLAECLLLIAHNQLLQEFK